MRMNQNMRSTSWLIAGIVIWGCMFGLMFDWAGVIASEDHLTNVGSSVLGSAVFTLGFVKTFRMQPPPTKEFRAFFYPIIGWVIAIAAYVVVHSLGA